MFTAGFLSSILFFLCHDFEFLVPRHLMAYSYNYNDDKLLPLFSFRAQEQGLDVYFLRSCNYGTGVQSSFNRIAQRLGLVDCGATCAPVVKYQLLSQSNKTTLRLKRYCIGDTMHLADDVNRPRSCHT